MNRLLLIAILVLSVLTANATHNRGGEITYRWIEGFTYEITITTYTKTSAPADRDLLYIFWGDGTPRDSIDRIFPPNLIPDRDAQRNRYTKTHTYPGPGTYDLCVVDPNRNIGVLNISNSVLQLFSITSTLRISGAISPNSSVTFQNPPLQDACIFQPWIYSPGAVDVNNDSLRFRLVPSKGSDCGPFPEGTYVFPDQINGENDPFPNPNNQLSINPVTGLITWDSPQRLGEYNIAFVVEEYRNGVLVGTVLRDMQINVIQCDNVPPVIAPVPDVCVEAGQNINYNIEASDPDGNNIQLSGFGSPFSVPQSPATLTQTSFVSPVIGNFNWNTTCAHVRLNPYALTFQAADVGQGASLIAITEALLTVVAPAPENLVAEATGAGIFLNWDVSPCTQATGYKIYRRINPFGFEPDDCETGVPEYTGFTLLDQVEGLENTAYVDTEEVIFGREMCYMVVACFDDGAESYASNEACAEIEFEIPIIKKNSIGFTDQVMGRDTVEWRSPVDLDTELFPGPYSYRLLRSEGYEDAIEVIWESPEPLADLNALDTQWISPALNTRDTAHTYRVELYSGNKFAGRANKAGSLFIELIPNDNEIEVTWIEELPWINFAYDIYRRGPNEDDFELIATVDTIGYRDRTLINNLEYCYYIVSYGSYFAIGENDTLINFSQQSCSVPFDRTPPCPPVLEAADDCEALTVNLNWTNPNIDCDETDDAVTYQVYFKPTEADDFELLAVIDGAMNNDFNFSDTLTIAGCYAVTALDSLAPWPNGEIRRNESGFSNIICIDNCPEYSLPNVFTPNNDGRNDVFVALPYRSIIGVEMTIFNRWGNIVFETTDPDILWDGTSRQSGELVSASTYFYTCKVLTIRLSGIVPVNLSGNISVFSPNASAIE